MSPEAERSNLPSGADAQPMQDWQRRSLALLTDVLPLSDEAFHKALSHSEDSFRLLDGWTDYRCVDTLIDGLPKGYSSGTTPRVDEYLLAPLLTSPVEGQHTSLPLLKAFLLVGVVDGRPERQLLKQLADGVMKARRPGSWRRVIPVPLPATAPLATVLAHFRRHVQDRSATPDGWSTAEADWLDALLRWCKLIESGDTARRRARPSAPPRLSSIDPDGSFPLSADEGLVPPPAVVVHLSVDDPPPKLKDEEQPDEAELALAQLAEAPFRGLQAVPQHLAEPETPDAGEARRARTGFRTALENQFLPWANGQLVADDLHSLVLALKEDLGSTKPTIQDTAGVLAFAHVTGQLVEQAAGVGRTVAKDRSYLKGRVFMRYVEPQEGAWEPTEAQAIGLRPRATHIPLLLPADLVDWLDRRLPADSRIPLCEAIGTTPVAARARARERLTALRESTGGLQSLSRVEWWLAQAMYQPGTERSVRCDHVRPHLVCAVTDGQPCPTAYYRAYKIHEVSALHREVLSNAGWSMPEALLPGATDRRWVGSRLNLEASQVRDLWCRVTRHFEAKVRDEQAPLHIRHNARELHECFSLVFQTLHRVVADPLESLEFIDLQTRRLMIDDKWQGEARAHRLVPLTRLAARQCEEHIEHVRRLSMAVVSSNPATAHTLLTMIEHPEWRVAPFRFLLDENLKIVRITPSALLAELEAIWDLPLNLARHFSSTWLLEHGVSDEALSSLLGHHDLGTQNLSQFSPRDFDDLYRPLIPLLDELVSELDLRSIPTFLPPVEAGKQVARPRGRPAVMTFGHKRREQVRARQFARLAAATQGWIKEQLDGGGPDKLNQDDVEALFERVRKETANRRTFWANARFESMRAALVEILRQHEDLKLDLPAITLTIKDVSHVCPMDGLASARWLVGLRRCIREYWERERACWRAVGNLHYLATPEAVVLTLIVDSLVIDPEVWKLWFSTDREMRPFLDEEDRAWMRMPLPNGNTRMYPLRREIAELVTGVAAAAWTLLTPEKVSALANELGAASDEARSIKDFWQLLNRVQGGSAAQMPGLVLGFADGSHNSVSPETMCLERRAGQAPTVVSQEAWQLQKRRPEHSDALGISAAGLSAGIGKLSDVADFRKRMSKALLTMERTAYAKRDKSKRRPKEKPGAAANQTPDEAMPKAGRGPGPVTRFAEAIEAQWDELVDSPRLGATCGLAARWLHKLATSKKSDGTPYASKTLRNYWYSWALRVVEEFGPIDPRHLSPAECEELYLQIVEDADVENRQHLYPPMRSFHRFLVNEQGVSEIEWSELQRSTGHGLTHVDANLIFKPEYLRALDLLRADEAVSPRVRAMQATVLVLVYRFGLRIAECLGLRGTDVRFEISSARWSVRVRGNQYRSLKTANARRTVVALEDLSDVEQEVLRSWASHVAAFADAGEVAPLFASAAAGQRRVQLFPRRVIALRVAQALRIATGDPSVRIHHCRHTYATRILQAGLGFVFDGAPHDAAIEGHRLATDQILKTLTNETEPTRRLIWAIAVALGHSSPLTSLETYCHLGHEWLRGWCDRHLWSATTQSDPIEIEAWSAGVTRKTLQRALQRRRTVRQDESTQALTGRWSRLARIGEGPRAQRDTQLPALRLVEGKNTLISVDRIVDHARRFGRVDGLAQSLFVSEQWIEMVLQVAQDYAGRHRTSRTPPEQWWIEPAQVQYPEHEGLQIDLALETLEEVDSGDLDSVCELLEHCLAPRARMVVIERPEVLTEILKLTQLLIEDLDHVQLLLPAKLSRRLTPAERQLRDKEVQRRAEASGRPARIEKPRHEYEHGIAAPGIEQLLHLAQKLKISVEKHGRVVGGRDQAHDWLNPTGRLGLRVKENASGAIRSAKVFTRVLVTLVVAQKALRMVSGKPATDSVL